MSTVKRLTRRAERQFRRVRETPARAGPLVEEDAMDRPSKLALSARDEASAALDAYSTEQAQAIEVSSSPIPGRARRPSAPKSRRVDFALAAALPLSRRRFLFFVRFRAPLESPPGRRAGALRELGRGAAPTDRWRLSGRFGRFRVPGTGVVARSRRGRRSARCDHRARGTGM